MNDDGVERYLKERRKALGLPPGAGDSFSLKYGRTEAELRDTVWAVPSSKDPVRVVQFKSDNPKTMIGVDFGEEDYSVVYNVDTDNPLGGEAHVHTPACIKGGDGTGVWLLVITLGALALGYFIGWLKWGVS